MTLAKEYPKIMIIGGGGYVGSALVPKLLSLGCKVAVLDLFLYGEDVLPEHPNLEESERGYSGYRIHKKGHERGSSNYPFSLYF